MAALLTQDMHNLQAVGETEKTTTETLAAGPPATVTTAAAAAAAASAETQGAGSESQATPAPPGCRTLQELAGRLGQLDYMFDAPKLEFEQYHTPPDIAARFLWSIREDLSGSEVADLGTGQGILGIGAHILGATRVCGFEIDPAAARKAIANAQGRMEVELCDVKKGISPAHHLRFDVVVTNPPFGTKSKKADIKFLSTALKLSRRAVYSLHKSTTRDYLLQRAERWGLYGSILAEITYPLPKTYAMHSKAEAEVKVCVLKLIKPDTVIAAEAAFAAANAAPAQ